MAPATGNPIKRQGTPPHNHPVKTNPKVKPTVTPVTPGKGPR